MCLPAAGKPPRFFPQGEHWWQPGPRSCAHPEHRHPKWATKLEPRGFRGGRYLGPSLHDVRCGERQGKWSRGSRGSLPGWHWVFEGGAMGSALGSAGGQMILNDFDASGVMKIAWISPVKTQQDEVFRFQSIYWYLLYISVKSEYHTRTGCVPTSGHERLSPILCTLFFIKLLYYILSLFPLFVFAFRLHECSTCLTHHGRYPKQVRVRPTAEKRADNLQEGTSIPGSFAAEYSMDTCLTAKYSSLFFLSLNGCFDKLWLLRSWSSVGR